MKFLLSLLFVVLLAWVAPPAAGAVTLPFFDDFSGYAPGSNGTPIWVTENYGATPHQEVSGGEFLFSGATPLDEPISYLADFSYLDYVASAKVKCTGNLSGLAFLLPRYLNINNKYEVAVDFEFSSVSLNKVVAGNWSSISSVWMSELAPIQLDHFYTVEVQVSTEGATTRFEVSIDGLQYINTTDSDLTYTGFGILAYHTTSTYSIHFDDVSIILIPPPVPAPTIDPLRLSLIFYGNHNRTVDPRIIAAKPEYDIDNPPHGLYGEIAEQQYHAGYSAYTSLLQNIASYQAAGIKVIGYVAGGYEGTHTGGSLDAKWYSLSMNMGLIGNMSFYDGVDGVFVDECTDFPNAASKTYLTTLSTLAHSYGLIVWMNTGTSDFDPWYFTSGIADFVHSTELWSGQPLSSVQEQWGSRISVSGYGPHTAQEAYSLTSDAWCKGLGYCYVTVDYTSLPTWFSDYTGMLRGWTSCPLTMPPGLSLMTQMLPIIFGCICVVLSLVALGSGLSVAGVVSLAIGIVVGLAGVIAIIGSL